MNKLLYGALALLLIGGLSPQAKAQTISAQTVSACGTPNNTPVVGNSYPLTMDTTGHLCNSAAGGGGGGAVTIADGADVTLGAKADSAWVSGSGSAISILKGIFGNTAGPVPAGTNVIGHVINDASTAVIGHVIVDTAPTTAVTGTFWQAIQPISASSLPLPTGAMGATGGTVGLVAGSAVIGHVITDSGSTTAVTGNVTTLAGGNSFANISTATTTTVKSGAGTLHTVCINTDGTVASTTTIYDNTAGSGTKIGTINSLAVTGCQIYDIAFSTGLTLVTTGTAAPDVTVSYR